MRPTKPVQIFDLFTEMWRIIGKAKPPQLQVELMNILLGHLDEALASMTALIVIRKTEKKK